jgi:hypothetical protein
MLIVDVAFQMLMLIAITLYENLVKRFKLLIMKHKI